MRSLNKLMLIGNVGMEPEIRSAASGARVAKFSLATNRKWKTQSGGEQERTEWHRVTCFGKLADIVEQYVHKGDRLYVEGRIEYSETVDDDGRKRYWADVIAGEMVMLGGKSGAPLVDSDLPFS